MNIKVVYHSETGNTKKVAEAIAAAVGVNAEPITEDMKIENVDILFIGGFLKAFTLVKPTKQLLKSIDRPDKAKCIAVFSTSASGRGILKYAKKYVKNPDVKIFEDFKCRGKYNKANPDCPTEDDLKNAEEFAKNVVSTCNLD